MGCASDKDGVADSPDYLLTGRTRFQSTKTDEHMMRRISLNEEVLCYLQGIDNRSFTSDLPLATRPKPLRNTRMLSRTDIAITIQLPHTDTGTCGAVLWSQSSEIAFSSLLDVEKNGTTEAKPTAQTPLTQPTNGTTKTPQTNGTTKTNVMVLGRAHSSTTDEMGSNSNSGLTQRTNKLSLVPMLDLSQLKPLESSCNQRVGIVRL